MVRMNGLDLVLQLSQIRFSGKILVITGSLNRNLENDCRSLGVDTILYKPFDPAVLRNAIRNLMGMPWQLLPVRAGYRPHIQ